MPNTLREDDFSRIDESDDLLYWATPRDVDYLDSRALETIESLVGSLIDETSPAVLDLMAARDSHIPASLEPSRVTGLGLNRQELEQNAALTAYNLHDLNKHPRLCCPARSFDAVLCTIAIDRMTRPFEVFSDVARVLRPGGLFLVSFSNRMLEDKAVRIWRESTEAERVAFVECLFRRTPDFEQPRSWVSKGKPRRPTDRYSGVGFPSDPIYAVFADKRGGQRAKARSTPAEENHAIDTSILDRRKARIRRTLQCPYCEDRLLKWEVPQSAFSEWPNEFFYVCFNDECSYFLRGWEAMSNVGATCSYRLMWDSLRDACHPVPVFTKQMLRDGIVEDERQESHG